MKKAIIYLHGFNSASLDSVGNLLIGKDKLRVMQTFCAEKQVLFFAPNVDYRDFQRLVEDMWHEWSQLLGQGFDVVFMGSSLGGFACEYLAMKTRAKAIMINPAINPSALLPQFTGVTENFETGQPYFWSQPHCDQYLRYEQELADSNLTIDRTILLDMADEVLDAEKTRIKYQGNANVLAFEGGSHGFEHMAEALAAVERVVFSEN
ncbi:MAG: YqiA/YcfP family alpha/beta fold hydrolase [Gammaproteobacteria bacterium]